jgi:antirestriction protein ArdC
MSQVYSYVTERIVGLMEKGTIPWERPWQGGGINDPVNITGRRYNGCNFFLLSILGFSKPVFLTFNQIKKAGGTIKKGQEKRHAPVYYWKWLEKTDATTGKLTKFPMLRYFLVWNIEQVEGVELPKKLRKDATTEAREFNPIEAAEAIVAGYPNRPTMSHVGSMACYIPSQDAVQMPDRTTFKDENFYYSTLFHELGHSTGHGSRLNRKEVTDPISFGSHSYSQEELVAELTAAFLSAESGINNENTERNTVAYLQSWIAKLKGEPKWFMIAAGKAQKAADMILNRQLEVEEEIQEAA